MSGSFILLHENNRSPSVILKNPGFILSRCRNEKPVSTFPDTAQIGLPKPYVLYLFSFVQQKEQV